MSTYLSRALFVLAAVTAFTGRPSLAQQGPLTLDEVLKAVTRDNPDLRSARLEAEALTTRRAQVSALPDPMAGVMYMPFPMLTAHGEQRTQWHVEQALPYPGKLALQGDIAGLSADVAGHEASAMEADLQLRAKEAYFDLYSARRMRDLIHAFQEELRNFEQVATARYEVGQGRQQAVLKAQLEKNRLSERLVDLDARSRSASETLARLTNAPGGTRVFETADLEPPLVPRAEIAALIDVSAKERAEMAALEAAEARAARQVDLARKQFLPDFSVSVTYFDIASADAPPTATGRDALAIGASVKVPLQRGRLRAQVEEAELRTRQVAARREALRTEIETDLQDLLYTLEREEATLELFDQTLLPQASSTVEATLNAYTAGTTDFLDLLDAERTIFSLRTSRVDALQRYLKTAARLERVLGIHSLEELDILLAARNDEVNERHD